MSRLHFTALSVVFLARSKTNNAGVRKGESKKSMSICFTGFAVDVLPSVDKKRRFQRKAKKFFNLHSSVNPQDDR